MSTERDKYLTESLGECWHGISRTNNPRHTCTKCGLKSDELYTFTFNNFSTPDGFFKLWNWAQEQEWFIPFTFKMSMIGDSYHMRTDIIHPDRFSNAVYKFLKESDKNEG